MSETNAVSRDASGADGGATLGRREFFRVGAGAAAATAGIAAGSGTVAAAYDGWLEDVSNYEGTVDHTGEDEVTVTVGAGNGLLFDPPAILVDPGTTVVWEWSGQGGQHNVVHADGDAFGSELTEEAGYTFEHVFEEEGTFPYSCEPHETVGMKGVVAVGSTDDDLVEPEGGGGEGGSGGGDSNGDSGGGSGSANGSGGGDGGNASAPASGGVTLSGNDLVGIGLTLGFSAVLFALAFGNIDPEE
ncbi:halocyanin domain-containing protein [Halopenitus salinus]|jgi:halocyanin-like protein|uniref:Halocyanin domain-containing protein n=1 Tax=Halopenitus salinus TaxID=1198295 RepID=A0ABD5UWB5_9EURY